MRDKLSPGDTLLVPSLTFTDLSSCYAPMSSVIILQHWPSIPHEHPLESLRRNGAQSTQEPLKNAVRQTCAKHPEASKVHTESQVVLCSQENVKEGDIYLSDGIIISNSFDVLILC